MKTVYFKNNQYHIDSKYKPLLKKLAQQCSSDSTVFIKILGYADTTGTVGYNDLLSQKRIVAVYKYLQFCAKIDSTKVHFWANGSSDEWYDLHLKGAHIQEKAVDILLKFKTSNN